MAPQGAIFLRKHIRPSCGAGEKCSQWNEIVFFRHCKERSDAAIHPTSAVSWIASLRSQLCRFTNSLIETSSPLRGGRLSRRLSEVGVVRPSRFKKHLYSATFEPLRDPHP